MLGELAGFGEEGGEDGAGGEEGCDCEEFPGGAALEVDAF